MALMTLATSAAIIAPETAQPVLAALIISMLVSPLVIRSNSDLTAWMEKVDASTLAELDQEMLATRSLAERNHVVICGYGRVGQNVARLLEEEGFEYIALDLIRAGYAVPVRPGIQYITETPGKQKYLKGSDWLTRMQS